MASKAAQLAERDNALLTTMSFRNKLINGNFDFWQRGFSQTGTGFGSADRWCIVRDGSTSTLSRQAFADGQTDVPGNPRFFARVAVTTAGAAGSRTLMEQRIEDAATLSGENAVLTLWAKADEARPLSVQLVRHWNGAEQDTVHVEKVALTDEWQKYRVKMAIASVAAITGQTRGSLRVRFWFDAGTNFDSATDSLGTQSGTFDIAQVQLESGSAETPFEHRPLGQELMLCQRYFEKSYQIDVAPGTPDAYKGSVVQYQFNTPGTGPEHAELFCIRYGVRKYGNEASITFYSPKTGATNNVWNSDIDLHGTLGSGPSPLPSSDTVGVRRFGNAPGSVPGNILMAQWAAQAEIVP